MLSPKKGGAIPSSVTTRSVSIHYQHTDGPEVTAPLSSPRRHPDKVRTSNTSTPSKSKSVKSPYASPHSPIASACQTPRVNRAKSVPISQTTRSKVGVDTKTETFFSPAYKTEGNEGPHVTSTIQHRTHSVVSVTVGSSNPQQIKGESKPSQIQIEVCTTEVQTTTKTSETEEYDEEFDPFLFIKNLPQLTTEMKRRKPVLPRRGKSTPPVCLALDLDETLVHCSIQPLEKAELNFGVAFNGTEYKVYVRMRPYLAKFLRQVSQWFEIVVFTASQKVYADKLLNILDPKRRYIKHRVFRESCVCVDGNYLKDLTVLGRDIAKVAIVDNSVQAFGFQISNGIPIESWFDDDDDQELLNLIPFLQKLKDVKDVRPLIAKTFRLEEFINNL